MGRSAFSWHPCAVKEGNASTTVPTCKSMPWGGGVGVKPPHPPVVFRCEWPLLGSNRFDCCEPLRTNDQNNQINSRAFGTCTDGIVLPNSMNGGYRKRLSCRKCKNVSKHDGQVLSQHAARDEGIEECFTPRIALVLLPGTELH